MPYTFLAPNSCGYRQHHTVAVDVRLLELFGEIISLQEVGAVIHEAPVHEIGGGISPSDRVLVVFSDVETRHLYL